MAAVFGVAVTSKDDGSADAGSVGEVAQLWREELSGGGYQHHCHSRLRVLWTKHHPPSVLRRVIRLARLRSGMTVLEVGCGGGAMLAPLALMGCRVTGVDSSREVLTRARHYLDELAVHARSNLSVDFVEGDFLELRGATWRNSFDAVLSFGVVEHFLVDEERSRFLRKMVELTAPGGAVVNVVPAGAHPLRPKMRAQGLGGYRIPEVDYTLASLAAEMSSAGLTNVRVLGHNLMGYLCINPNRHMRRFYRVLVLALKIVPMSLLPEAVQGRYVDTLIAAGYRA